MTRTLAEARKIMYGHVKQVIPDATLDYDLLKGEHYEGQWDSDDLGETYISVCDHIFTEGSMIFIYDPLDWEDMWKKMKKIKRNCE